MTGTGGRAGASPPVGTVTRGTTAPNRLRRVDRWLAGPQAWRLQRAASPPLVVDLGYGASPVTTVELYRRLRCVRGDVQVVGVEIDPARVAAAQHLAGAGLSFRLGGFELSLPGGQRPVLVRAFNVLRQYAEADVAQAWRRVTAGLAPDGLLVDGTCDELGRVSTWVAVGGAGAQSFTVSLRLAELGGERTPAVLAERLPKVLIHRNVPGERVHDFVRAVEASWVRAAGYAAYGRRQRWLATARALAEDGWPVLDDRRRWRLGELSVAWSAVRPLETSPPGDR